MVLKQLTQINHNIRNYCTETGILRAQHSNYNSSFQNLLYVTEKGCDGFGAHKTHDNYDDPAGNR